MPKNDDSMWEIGGVAANEVGAPGEKAEGSMPPRANQNRPVSSLETPIPKLLEIASLPEGGGDTDVPMMDLGIMKLAMQMPVEKPEGSMAPPGTFVSLGRKLAFFAKEFEPRPSQPRGRLEV